MLNKYKTKSGVVFYLDNTTNVLYDKDKNKLSKPVSDWMGAMPPFETVVKHNRPTELKIILGQSCNYSCGYCVQKDVGDHERKVSHFDAEFLWSRIQDNIDLSDIDQVELWGGETLLYWDEVQYLMMQFDPYVEDFVIPTNGTPLKKEHIDFFASLESRTTIELSHDGPGHEIRGNDFLERKVDVLKEVEKYPEQIRFIMSVTINNHNYDLNAINDWFGTFYDKHGVNPIPLIIRPVWAYNTISEQYSLDTVIPAYQKSLETYLDRQIKQFKENKGVVDGEMVQSQLFHVTIEDDENNGILQMASNFRYELDKGASTICGMHTSDSLTIDHMGNIRACHNVGNEYFSGNIDDFNVKKEIAVNGITNKKRGQCLECPVYSYCLGGCPLELKQEMFDKNCQVNYAHHSTMLLKALEVLFGEEVEPSL